MKLFKAIIPFLFLGGSLIAQNKDSLTIRRIFDEALTNGHAYNNLEYLCKKIGPRLSGSANAQKAVDWSKKLMEGYSFDRVYLQNLMVPVWERGAKEVAYIIEGNTKIPVPVTALGGSIASQEAGLRAEIVEVQSFEELKAQGEKVVKGKIVFFNRPFDQKILETFEAYGLAVDQRGQGAIQFYLKQSFRTLPEAPSFNVIAEMAKQNNEKHIAAIESDEGGFTPRGFAIENVPDALDHIPNWKALLKPYKVNDIEAGDSGSDIGPLRNIPGTVLIGFKPDSQRYFDIHHSSNDVFENVNKRELELGAASITALIYLIDQYGAR